MTSHIKMLLLCLCMAAGALTSADDPTAVNDIVINEIHHHPADDCEGEEFLELYNRSAHPVDMTGWRFTRGVQFTFPEGLVLMPGEYLVLARYPEALRAAFSLPPPPAKIFQYEGVLSNSGEELVLVNALDEVVDYVDYGDRFPWPTSTDGGGPSLECLNPDRDNSTAANWRPAGMTGPRWRHYTARGTAATNTLSITLSGPGEFLIDDVSLKRTGTTTELIANTGFESASLSPWSRLGNHTSSSRYTDVAHTGDACLKVTATGAGGAGNGVFQVIDGLVLDTVEYELSFWALRLTPGLQLKTSLLGVTASLSESRDIGSVSPAGSSSETGGVYTVSGSGADIWGSSDAFRYVYTPVTGDAQIEAVVSWGTAPHSWAKAGLMVRETTSASSAHAMCILSRDNGVRLQFRATAGGDSNDITGAALSDTARLRLTRTGNTLTGEVFTGERFEVVGATQIQMGPDVLVGLAVTSHQNGALATATFANVALNGQGLGLSAATAFSEDGNESIATPLAPNTQLTADMPPFIHRIRAHVPTGNPDTPYTRRIGSGDAVHLSAIVEDLDGDPITEVWASYQVVTAGDYVRIDAPGYLQNWVTVPMRDDGIAPDVQAGDGVFTALIPPQPHRTLVRYRVRATSGGLTTHVPYPDDEVPNLAYFVYDGVPDYVANLQSAHGSLPRVHRAEDLTNVPVYHFICHADDMLECEYKEIPFGSKVARKQFNWQGTFVYDPMDGGERQVYDNVRFRLRGGVWRYSWPKRMYKLRFARGHYFRGHFNDGTRYPEPRRSVNIQSIVDQDWTHIRGINGIPEVMTFWLFKGAGVAAPETTYVHFRTITGAQEHGQYTGDFKGLFLDIEQPDRRYLSTNDRPLGNLYKIDTGAIGQDGGRPGRWDKEVTNCEQSENDADLAYFYDTYNSGTQTEDWWRAHLDLDRYYSYRAVLDSVRHYDIQHGKNYYYYHNSATGLWEPLPWDTDLILGWSCCGDTTYGRGEPFWQRTVETYPNVFGIAYRNRLREYLQLLGNRETIDPMIDRWTALIAELHKADRDRWDYFVIPAHPWGPTNSGNVDKTPRHGLYRSLSERVNRLRSELTSRLNFMWSDSNHFCGVDGGRIPRTPSIIVPPTSPIVLDSGELSFVSGAFYSPRGMAHAATLWQAARAGEVELLPEWSEVRYTELSQTVLPADLLAMGVEYLVRVRHEDSTGRMSLWSDPVRVTIIDSQSQKPEAFVVASPMTGRAPLTVTFDASHSSDPDGDPLTFWWDFGNGATANGALVQHTFTTLGDWTVTLLVNDGRGRTDTATTVIRVRECSEQAALALGGDWPMSGGVLELDAPAGEEFTFAVTTHLMPNAAFQGDGIRGWSLGVAHDPSILELVSVDLAPQVESLLGENPFTSASMHADGFTQTVLLSTTTDTEIPAHVTDLPTARAVYRLAAPHDTPGEMLPAVLEFSNAIGAPPVDILINPMHDAATPCSLSALYVMIRITDEYLPVFLRGDANLDTRRDISDAVAILQFLFAGGELPCHDAADANDDGQLNVADAITLLGHLFANTGPLPEPFEVPGPDPTPGELGCAQGL